MAGASLLILGYQNFVAQKSLLKRLYGEERQDDEPQDDQSTKASATAEETLWAKIEKR